MEKRYSESHEWISLEGEIATVGVTDYAQQELGEVVYVDLPQVGIELKTDSEAVILESTKAAVDLYSPLDGEVTEVNARLRESPDLINRSPNDQGWLFKLHLSDPDQFSSLLDEAAYNKLIG